MFGVTVDVFAFVPGSLHYAARPIDVMSTSDLPADGLPHYL